MHVGVIERDLYRNAGDQNFKLFVFAAFLVESLDFLEELSSFVVELLKFKCSAIVSFLLVIMVSVSDMRRYKST
jgi:hypothetical protein